MPERIKGETRAEWMKRCIPVVRGEGASLDYAIAKCAGMWENGELSEPVVEESLFDLWLQEEETKGPGRGWWGPSKGGTHVKRGGKDIQIQADELLSRNYEMLGPDGFEKLDEAIGLNYGRISTEYVQGYTGNSSVNRRLRAATSEDDWSDADRQQVDMIEGAMTRCPYPYMTYRGVKQDVFGGLEPGDTFVEKGLLSTSYSERTATGFSAMEPGKTAHVAQILVPEGIRAVAIPKAEWKGSIREEQEILFGHGTKMQYLGTTTKTTGGRKVIVHQMKIFDPLLARNQVVGHPDLPGVTDADYDEYAKAWKAANE